LPPSLVPILQRAACFDLLSANRKRRADVPGCRRDSRPRNSGCRHTTPLRTTGTRPHTPSAAQSAPHFDRHTRPAYCRRTRKPRCLAPCRSSTSSNRRLLPSRIHRPPLLRQTNRRIPRPVPSRLPGTRGRKLPANSTPTPFVFSWPTSWGSRRESALTATTRAPAGCSALFLGNAQKAQTQLEIAVDQPEHAVQLFTAQLDLGGQPPPRPREELLPGGGDSAGGADPVNPQYPRKLVHRQPVDVPQAQHRLVF
jgi:hypothetical protein